MKFQILSLLFTIFCLLGCLYLIIQVTQDYLRFDTEVNVSFESSQSQSKVPLITFCKPRYALMRNEALRNPLKGEGNPLKGEGNPLKGEGSSTPSSIDNSTFAIDQIFQLKRQISDKEQRMKTCNCHQPIQNQKVNIQKTVNYWYVCYNVQHSKFASNKRRKQKFIYEFLLFNHHSSPFHMFVTSDNQVPNGDMSNGGSIKLIGKLKHHRLTVYYYFFTFIR